MKFTSDDRESSVALVLTEIDDNPYMPGVKLEIAVRDRAFYGAITSWFEKDNLQQFVSEFNKCAKLGRDSAQLMSMGPEEAEIHVQRSDSVGHFMLSYKVSANNYVRAGAIMTILAGSFDLDSEYLRQYTSSLEELAAEARIGQILDGSERG
jgi:hypothetical protein